MAEQKAPQGTNEQDAPAEQTLASEVQYASSPEESVPAEAAPATVVSDVVASASVEAEPQPLEPKPDESVGEETSVADSVKIDDQQSEEESKPPRRPENIWVLANEVRETHFEMQSRMESLRQWQSELDGRVSEVSWQLREILERLEVGRQRDAEIEDDENDEGQDGHRHETAYRYQPYAQAAARNVPSAQRAAMLAANRDGGRSGHMPLLMERLVACICGEPRALIRSDAVDASGEPCGAIDIQTCVLPDEDASQDHLEEYDGLGGFDLRVVGQNTLRTITMGPTGSMRVEGVADEHEVILLRAPEGYSVEWVSVDDEEFDEPGEYDELEQAVVDVMSDNEDDLIGWWRVDLRAFMNQFAGALLNGDAGADDDDDDDDDEDDDDATDELIDVIGVHLNGRDAHVEICFIPEPAEVTVCAVTESVDGYGGGSWSPVRGVSVDIYRRNERIGCVTTEGQGGCVDVSLPPGPVTFVPRSRITAAGRTYRLATNAAFVAQLQSGKLNQAIQIPYVPIPSEVRVAAHEVRQRKHGREEQVPLKVEFALYRGTNVSEDALVQRLTTGGRSAEVFSDLDGGIYTLVASPIGNGEHESWELDAPGAQTRIVTVPPGTPVDLTKEYTYRNATGSVVVTVVDERGKGLPNVDVTLWPIEGQGISHEETTDSDGEAEFDFVRPGLWSVALMRSKLDVAGRGTYVLSKNGHSGGNSDQTIAVKPGKTNREVTFQMEAEVHKIVGTVTRGGRPVREAQVEIFADFSDDDPIDAIWTDDKGHYEYTAPAGGTYWVAVSKEPKGKVTTNSEVTYNVELDERYGYPGAMAAGYVGGGPPVGDVIGDALREFTAFPIQTDEVDGGGGPISGFPTGGGGGGALPVSRLVDQTMRQLLGLRARTSNPRAFVNALNQAFVREGTAEVSKLVWKPRTYAAESVLDGGVTGAQASVHTRMQAAVDAALPLLDGLYALNGDSDPEDTQAIRSVVRNLLQEMVNELSIAGGPRVARVDQLFDLLLGDDADVTDPDDVEGQLGGLRIELGLRSGAPVGGEANHVNTIEEEQNVTNFRILVDYVTGMRHSWESNRQYFTVGSNQAFFGTQLVLLQRQLSVITESTEEVRAAMNSVFIGPAERQTIALLLPDDVVGLPTAGLPWDSPLRETEISSDSISIEELLSWVGDFSGEQGGRLIEDGGKLAVRDTFLPIVITLRNHVYGALQAENGAALPAGYKSQRVRRALQEMASQLHQLAILTVPIANGAP